jgi:hypothetical protein
MPLFLSTHWPCIHKLRRRHQVSTTTTVSSRLAMIARMSHGIIGRSGRPDAQVRETHEPRRDLAGGRHLDARVHASLPMTGTPPPTFTSCCKTPAAVTGLRPSDAPAAGCCALIPPLLTPGMPCSSNAAPNLSATLAKSGPADDALCALRKCMSFEVGVARSSLPSRRSSSCSRSRRLAAP